MVWAAARADGNGVLRVQAEVTRCELARREAVGEAVDGSALDAALAAALPPHCQLCGARDGVDVCSGCGAVGWCPAHRSAPTLIHACRARMHIHKAC